MTTGGLERFVNIALYYAGWFCCVLGGAHGRPWLASALAAVPLSIHLVLVNQPRRELELVLVAGAIGGVADSVQSCLGLLIFPPSSGLGCLAPPWILLLWMQFATLVRFSMSFLAGRYAIAALLGGLGGPLAFWAGARLGAVEFTDPAWHSALTLALVWAIAFPLLFALGRRGGHDRLVRYRFAERSERPPHGRIGTHRSLS